MKHDPMDVAYNRFEDALKFACVGVRWCKVCARKLYILRRRFDGVLRDFTADGAEHMWLDCGEEIDQGEALSKQAVERVEQEDAACREAHPHLLRNLGKDASS